jgi:hypothetical protein
VMARPRKRSRVVVGPGSDPSSARARARVADRVREVHARCAADSVTGGGQGCVSPSTSGAPVPTGWASGRRDDAEHWARPRRLRRDRPERRRHLPGSEVRSRSADRARSSQTD